MSRDDLVAGVRLFVPSYRRAGIRCITQRWLPKARMLVCESEVEEYRRSGNVVRKDDVIPDEVQGNLPRVLNWILENKVGGARCVIIMDDDVSAIGKWYGGTPRKLTAGEFEEFVEAAVVMAQDVGARMWGVNPITDKQSYRECSPFSFTAFLGGPFRAHMAPYPMRYDVRLTLKDDYDMTLQVLARYRYTLRFNAYHYYAKIKEQAGGNATFRNISREKEQNALLLAKWGSKILKPDRLGSSRAHRKKAEAFDPNLILHVPIGGV